MEKDIANSKTKQIHQAEVEVFTAEFQKGIECNKRE